MRDSETDRSKHDCAQLTWLDVRAEERVTLTAARADARAPDAGLAISGGGIRSATFALGVIQALAAHRKLSRFDYLSTVSGGGYIGSWLSALIHRRGQGKVSVIEPLIATPGVVATTAQQAVAKAVPELPTSVSHEDPALQWLRRYSNYLTPRVGLFGADTWTAIVTYTRNLTLNWLVLIALTVGVILLISMLMPAAHALSRCRGVYSIATGVFMLAVVAGFIALGLDLPSEPRPKTQTWRSRFKSENWIVILVAVTSLFAAWLVALGLGAAPPEWFDRDGTHAKLFTWIGAAGVCNVVIWGLAGVVRQISRNRGWARLPSRVDCDSQSGRFQSFFGLWLPVLVSGMVGGALAYAWADWRQLRSFLSATTSGFDASKLTGAAFDTYFGTIVILLLFSHVVLLFIGFAKRRMSESDREWFARLGAWLFLLSFLWLIAVGMLWLGAVAIPALNEFGDAWPVTGILVWAAQSIAAVILGKSALTGAGTQATRRRWLEIVLAVGPYVFVAGLIAIIGWTTLRALESSWPAADLPRPPMAKTVEVPLARHQIAVPAENGSGVVLVIDQVKPPEKPKSRVLTDATVDALRLLDRVGIPTLFGLSVLVLAITLLLSWRIDINLFSYNRFYANRLVRAYLGASRHRLKPQANPAEAPRASHPFTDLDPDDDLPMSAMAEHNAAHVAVKVQRPLHLVNTALNLTASSELAWQSRKAASFVFSPLHCGYALPTSPAASGVSAIDNIEGFRRSYAVSMMSEPVPTPGETGVTYGMSFPTSGAAASPNMGYHSTPSLALLLGLFNVRLGRWFGNPRDDAGAWQQRSPKISLGALMNELVGNANFTQPWLYLSDGGHFENLGVYELIRRRLPLILAIDGAQDPEYNFVDLANAMRLVRADFGVDIKWDDPSWAPEPLRTAKDSEFSPNAFAFGSIHYPDDETLKTADPDDNRWRAQTGTIIYVKPALLKDAPPDVLEYARRRSGFPQETTGDQWFSEAQFESYRRLGETIGLRLCSEQKFVDATR